MCLGIDSNSCTPLTASGPDDGPPVSVVIDVTLTLLVQPEGCICDAVTK